MFYDFLLHWEKYALQPSFLLGFMPPFLSEQTREIALSMLTARLPASARSDHEQTRKIWQTLKRTADYDEASTEAKHKTRRIGNMNRFCFTSFRNANK